MQGAALRLQQVGERYPVGQTEQRRSKEPAERWRFAMCPRGRCGPPNSLIRKMSLGSAHRREEVGVVHKGSMGEDRTILSCIISICQLLGLIGYVLLGPMPAGIKQLANSRRRESRAKPGQGQGSQHITMCSALTMESSACSLSISLPCTFCFELCLSPFCVLCL